MAYTVVNKEVKAKTTFNITPCPMDKMVYIVNADNQGSALTLLVEHLVVHKIHKHFLSEREAGKLSAENILNILGYKLDATKLTIKEKKKGGNYTMAKKEFEWTTQQQLGSVEVNDKEQRLIAMCSLGEGDEAKWFINFTTIKFFKRKGEEEETWRPVKGYTVPLDNWSEISQIINDSVEWEEE